MNESLCIYECANMYECSGAFGLEQMAKGYACLRPMELMCVCVCVHALYSRVLRDSSNGKDVFMFITPFIVVLGRRCSSFMCMNLSHERTPATCNIYIYIYIYIYIHTHTHTHTHTHIYTCMHTYILTHI